MASDPPDHPEPKFRPSTLGTQQFINPKYIAADKDIVMLSASGKLVRWLAVILSILAILLGIGLIIDGVSGFGRERIEFLFSLATHPLAGLAIGVLGTAVLQSSTTTTALTVTAVGVGVVSIPVAIPIILGANIGTTLTAHLISFSFVGRREEFGRAFASAALHGWFNLLMAAIFLPIELLFHPLERLSAALSSLLGTDVQGTETGQAFRVIFQPILDFLGTRGLLGGLFDPRIAAVMSLGIGTCLILLGVRSVSAQLRTLMAATTRTLLEKSSGSSDALGFFTGLGGTMALQASTVTVSSLLPFAAAGSLKPRELLSATLGANVGTTLSSLLVALTLPGALGGFALQAATVHVLFNLIGSLLVLLIPPIRNLIIYLADQHARLAQRSYTTTFTLILVFYFAVPATAIGIYSIFS